MTMNATSAPVSLLPGGTARPLAASRPTAPPTPGVLGVDAYDPTPPVVDPNPPASDPGPVPPVVDPNPPGRGNPLGALLILLGAILAAIFIH